MTNGTWRDIDADGMPRQRNYTERLADIHALVHWYTEMVARNAARVEAAPTIFPTPGRKVRADNPLDQH